jgi:hypothetical protein
MKRLHPVIFALLMGLMMSLVLTLLITFVRLGLAEGLFREWMKVWSYAYPAAVACILVFRPVAASLTERIVVRLGK